MNVITCTFPKSQTSNWVPLDLKRVKYIVIHHAEAIKCTWEDINKWHLIERGWVGGAGYNEFISKDGTVYIMRGDHIGCQCENKNSVSYGICLEGDYEKETTVPKPQLDSLIDRLNYHKSRFLNVEVVGHKDLNQTLCPGKNFPLKEVKQIMVEHWSQRYYDYLLSKGIDIKETRFDDTLKRGEAFKLLAYILGYKEG